MPNWDRRAYVDGFDTYAAVVFDGAEPPDLGNHKPEFAAGYKAAQRAEADMLTEDYLAVQEPSIEDDYEWLRSYMGG
jgi:hypothetical protein